MQSELASWLRRLRQFWRELVVGTAWLSTVTGSLLFLPVIGETGKEKVWLYFAQVVMMLLVGQIFLIAHNSKAKNNVTLWSGASFALLLTFAIGFYAYDKRKDEWTTSWDNRDWIVGSSIDLTPLARERIAELMRIDKLDDIVTNSSHPKYSEIFMYYDKLLEEMADTNSKQLKIWTKESLYKRWRHLAVIYSFSIQMLALSIICLMHAISVALAGKPEKGRKPKTKVVSVARGPEEVMRQMRGALAPTLVRLPTSNPAKPGLRSADIVFIHGLDGSADTTWTNPAAPQEVWPRWLAEDVQGLATWLLGYPAHSLIWGTETPVASEMADAILRAFRKEQIGERPLILIAHSFGGILLEAVLRSAERTPDCEKIIQHLKGIVLLSVPQTAEELEIWRNYTSASMTREESDAFCKEFTNYAGLSLWFEKFLNRTQVQVFSYRDNQIVVIPKGKAKSSLGTIAALPEDHLSITRLSSREKKLYTDLCHLIRQCVPASNELSHSLPAP